MREEEEGWRRGKVMLLTQHFETTFFPILFFSLSLCHFSICTPKTRHEKQPPHLKRWEEYKLEIEGGRGGGSRREGDLKKEHETGSVNFYSNAPRRQLEVTAVFTSVD